MGQASSSETLSISGGDGHRYWVGLSMKPIKAGCKKTTYKGVLLGSGPRQWEKVAVKSFSKIPGTKDSWEHEVRKSDNTKQLAAQFLQQYPFECKIRVVVPGIVQMDKVSNVNKWLANKKDGRGLVEDEWISVEELIPGKIFRYCPWKKEHLEDPLVTESTHLQAFSHFTYHHTNGALVACDFQGSCTKQSSISKYVFTDSIIHSNCKLYGMFDEGEYGITEFFKYHKCNDICKDWPQPTPLTPPPSFDEACAIQLGMSPPPEFENIVFPGQTEIKVPASEQRPGRRRHVSAHGPHRARQHQQVTDRLSVNENFYPQRRRSITVSNINRPTLDIPSEIRRAHSAKHIDDETPVFGDTQPPPYDSLVNLPTSNDEASTGTGAGNTPNSYQTQSHRTAVVHSFIPSSGNHAANHTSPSTHHQKETLRRVQSDAVQPTQEPRPVPHRSLTTVGLVAEYGDRSCSDNACHVSPLRQRRLQLQGSREGTNGATFFCGEVDSQLPPLIVPSAPPLEDEYLSVDNT